MCAAAVLVSVLSPAPVRNVVSCVFSIYFLLLFLKQDFHGISHWSCLSEKEALLLKSHRLDATVSHPAARPIPPANRRARPALLPE